MNSAKDEFYKHGGKIASMNKGKILLRCTSCSHSELVFKRVLDRRARPKCPACGWELVRSEKSRVENIDMQVNRKMVNRKCGSRPRL